MSISQNARHGVTGFYRLLDSALAAVDERTVVGLCLIVLGMAIVKSPDVGAAQLIGHMGISPTAYGYGAALAGGLILRLPRTTWYALLISPLLIYVLGFVGYLHDLGASGSIAPLPFYVGFLLLAYKAGFRRSGRGEGEGH